jgi:hypothetical protein
MLDLRAPPAVSSADICQARIDADMRRDLQGVGWWFDTHTALTPVRVRRPIRSDLV